MRRLFFAAFVFYLVITLAGIIFVGSRLFLIGKDFNLLSEAQRSLLNRAELRDVIYELKYIAINERFSGYPVGELKTRAQAIVGKCKECHHEERVKSHITELEEKIGSLPLGKSIGDLNNRKQRILISVEEIIPSLDMAYSRAKSLVNRRLVSVEGRISDVRLTVIFSSIAGFVLFVGFSVNSISRITRLETDIKERERVLADWAWQWQKTFDSIEDMVFIVNDNCRISMMNEAAKNRYGEAIVGAAIENVLEKAFLCACQSVCKCGGGKEVSLNGSVFVVRSFPIRIDGREDTGCVLIIKDITSEKEMEMRMLQTEKLAALGKVIAAVAHELNNPLTAINGYSELLMNMEIDERAHTMIAKINKAGMRMADIVNDLLVFTGTPNLKIEPVNVRCLINSTVELISESLESNKININLEIEDCVVLMDKLRMERLLLNLITNSIQAIKESGKGNTITLKGYTKGDKFFIEVLDNGPGIPADIINRIFEPFFTTKGFTKGTGLGLSICYNIAKAHGGDISVKSIEGQGAKFIVELPYR